MPEVDVFDVIYNVNLDPAGDGASVGSVHFHAKAEIRNPSNSHDGIYALVVRFADNTEKKDFKIVSHGGYAMLSVTSDEASLASNPPQSLKVEKTPFNAAAVSILKASINFPQLPYRDVSVGHNEWIQTAPGLIMVAAVYGMFSEPANIPETNVTLAMINEDSMAPIPSSYPAGGRIMWSLAWAEGSFGIQRRFQTNRSQEVAFDQIATSIGTLAWDAATASFIPGADRYTAYLYVAFMP